MKVPMSDFLKKEKKKLKSLVEILSTEYDYVSLLGTDVSGTRYEVHYTGTSIKDSRWSERGFVIRIYEDESYYEYSFNSHDLSNMRLLAEKIKSLHKKSSAVLHDSGIDALKYKLIEEDKIEKSWCGDVKILPESMSAGDKDNYSYEAFSGLKGPELIDEIEGEVSSIVKEAEMLLDSARVKPGEYDVICSPGVSGGIAHESFGHGVEMDMFVKNRAKAVQYLNKPVGSPLLSMHDGARAANNISSYLFDDEGTIGTDTVVIENGIFKRGISDLLSALNLVTIPTGNGKRESFERKAYSRMTNTFFSPGKERLEDMISSISHGYLLEKMSSGMEDPKNWGIQCSILFGREIKDGKLSGKIVAPVILTGYVPTVLKSITMISDDFDLKGSGHCGKGCKEYVKVSSGGPYIKTSVYNNISSAKTGDNLQGINVKGDTVSISLEPYLPNSVYSVPYDSDGFPLKPASIIEGNVLKNYWGSLRYCHYLNEDTTGMIKNFKVKPGNISVNDYKKEPYLEIVYFSAFLVEPLTGDFGGEIRLGYYFDGKEKIPVTGGSIGGNINKLHQEIENFIGPETVKLLNVGVSGAG
ncbi:hypothetical protein ES705_33499 [subsurface metagenome]